MVVLKIMQYYSATGDSRVIGFMTRYFRYQFKTFPESPLGEWSFWAEYRMCDNLQTVYWQHYPDSSYLEAVDNGFSDLRLLHVQPQGMCGGDEPLHGSSPTQGS